MAYYVRMVGRNFAVFKNKKVVYRTGNYDALIRYLKSEVKRRSVLGFTTDIKAPKNWQCIDEDVFSYTY